MGHNLSEKPNGANQRKFIFKDINFDLKSHTLEWEKYMETLMAIHNEKKESIKRRS